MQYEEFGVIKGRKPDYFKRAVGRMLPEIQKRLAEAMFEKRVAEDKCPDS